MWTRIKVALTQFLIDRLDFETELPEDVQNLLDYMEEVGEGEDCMIYKGGKGYPMQLQAADGSFLKQPMVFRTNEERAAFGAGISYAAKLFGGSSVGFFEDPDLEKESDEMDKRATHLLRQRLS